MTLTDEMLESQSRFFRLAEMDGHSIKVLSMDSGIPETTVRSYKGTHGAQVKMPLEAALRLAKAAPAHGSVLTAPVGLMLCPMPDDWCPDAHVEMCNRYSKEYNAATHPDSDGGREITDREKARLKAVAS